MIKTNSITSDQVTIVLDTAQLSQLMRCCAQASRANEEDGFPNIANSDWSLCRDLRAIYNEMEEFANNTAL